MHVERAERAKITLDRTVDSSLQEVWDLWTTKEGIESWWGPEGFATKVMTLDLRVGGELAYSFTATAPEQIAFLQARGMPTTSHMRGHYTEVAPRARLAFHQRADFIPGVEPYDVATSVAFAQVPGGVTMTLTLDSMHDAFWTQMMKAGWVSELGKLANVIAARRGLS